MVHMKRAYDPASRGDGTRILVDRLWPRGVKKEEVNVAKWMKEPFPFTPHLSQMRHHWDEHRIAQILRPRSGPLERIPQALQGRIEKTRGARDVERDLQSGCPRYCDPRLPAKDEEHNQAVVISEVLGAHRDASA
jgi:uncharacterized protein YeaO (DUF488 family)